MILFLESGAGVLAASTAATAAVWLLATEWRRKIARTEVTQICIISASEMSCEKYDPQAVATAAKAAHIVLLLNIIYLPFVLRNLKKSRISESEIAAPDSFLKAFLTSRGEIAAPDSLLNLPLAGTARLRGAAGLRLFRANWVNFLPPLAFPVAILVLLVLVSRFLH